LQLIAEALQISEETGERWAIAEVLRIKAGLLLTGGRPTEEIEALLINSLQVARHQQALSWELRSARDLARLWQRQGRDVEGLRLVQGIYDQFIEGFDTEDLRHAQALQAQLMSSASGRSGGLNGPDDREVGLRQEHPPNDRYKS
jgi:predicted ATPase